MSSSSPERFVDLHVHTTWSDGRWSPARVILEAAERGLAAISVTDHDVLGGLDEADAAARQHRIEHLPGVELTADWDGRTIHVLGYGIDRHNPDLIVALERGRDQMGEHVDRVLEALTEAGEPIAASDLARYRTRYAGGASLVLAMVERGILRRAKNGRALLRLASQEPRAYTAAEAIALIHRAGGIAALAHPAKVRPNNPNPDREGGGPASPIRTASVSEPGGVSTSAVTKSPGRLPHGRGSDRAPTLLGADDLAPLVNAGLDGIEVWQIVHGPAEREHYAHVARNLGLLVTGGSDCHGPRRQLGPRLASQQVPYAVLEEIKRAISERTDAPE